MRLDVRGIKVSPSPFSGSSNVRVHDVEERGGYLASILALRHAY